MPDEGPIGEASGELPGTLTPALSQREREVVA